MNILQKTIKSIQSSFASYVEVTNASGIDVNPILKSLDTLNTRPTYKTIDNLEYIAFGRQDDVDLMIDKLNYKSSTHSGIITKKAKMISGSGLIVN